MTTRLGLAAHYDRYIGRLADGGYSHCGHEGTSTHSSISKGGFRVVSRRHTLISCWPPTVLVLAEPIDVRAKIGFNHYAVPICYGCKDEARRAAMSIYSKKDNDKGRVHPTDDTAYDEERRNRRRLAMKRALELAAADVIEQLAWRETEGKEDDRDWQCSCGERFDECNGPCGGGGGDEYQAESD